MAFCDKNGTSTANRLGLLWGWKNKDSNDNNVGLFAYKPENGSNEHFSFIMKYSNNGVREGVFNGDYFKCHRLVVTENSYGSSLPTDEGVVG